MIYNKKSFKTQQKKKYFIFISYSAIDSEQARFFAEYFNSLDDVEAYLSEQRLVPGEIISNVLIEKIKTSDMFIVLWSKNSFNSQYVQQEVGVAKGSHKLIIPILLDETKPTAMLQGIYYLSYYDETKRNAEFLRLNRYIQERIEDKKRKEALLLAGLAFAALSLLRED
jgi:hypothetical protein